MKAERVKLKNGLNIITVPMKDSPTVTVLVMVGAGSHYETRENNGISHFLEHMCFKGTKNRPEARMVSAELDALGSRSNAFTGHEYTGYWAKTSSKNTPRVLEIVSDLYLNPIFDKEEIEREKGVVIEEINMYEDLPQYKVYELLNKLLYGDQPAGWSILGPKKNIENMSRQHFVEYRDKHYNAPATTVVIAGDIDSETLVREIEEKFKGISEKETVEMPEVTERQKEPQILIKHKDTDQSHFMLGFRTFDTFDDRHYALKVLSGVLGRGMSSRLFHKLRNEMGVCYYVRSVTSAQRNVGYLAVASGVDTSRVEEVVSAVLDELRDLKKKKVSHDELEKAKEFVVGNMFMDLESTDDIAIYYAKRETYGKELKTPEEIAKRLRGVTAEDVMNVAHDVFVEKGINLALIGPNKDEKSLKSALVL